jgi:hypothetical protein
MRVWAWRPGDEGFEDAENSLDFSGAEETPGVELVAEMRRSSAAPLPLRHAHSQKWLCHQGAARLSRCVFSRRKAGVSRESQPEMKKGEECGRTLAR